MNQSALILHLGELLAWYRDHHDGPCHLCIFEGSLNFHKPGHTFKNHVTFGKVNLFQMREGLTPEQWHELTTPVISYLERNPKCLETPKPSPSPNNSDS